MGKKNNLSILSVEIIDGGVGGIVVNYFEKESVGNRVYLNGIKAKKNKPTHEDLINAFWKLKGYLLSIAGYGIEVMDLLSVTKVKWDGAGFNIEGKMKILGGDEEIGVKTPKLGISSCDDGEVIIEVIEEIFRETVDYMDHGKVMGDAQIVMRISEGNKGMEDLSDEQKTEEATKWLERRGAIVMMDNELVNRDKKDLANAEKVGYKVEVVGFEQKLRVRDEVVEAVVVEEVREEDEIDFSL